MAFLKSLFRRPQQFRDAVVAQLRARGDQRAVHWVDDDDGLHIVVLESHLGTGETLDLNEVFDEWKRSGDLASATRAIDEIARPGAVTAAGHTLLAVFNFTSDRSPLAPGLSLAVVHADEDGPEVLTPEQLSAAGLTFDEVVARLSPESLEVEAPNPEVQLYESSSPGEVLARLSTLTLPALPGEPVFILLDSERMLITGSMDARGLQEAAAVIREDLTRDSPDRLGLCYILRGGALVPWLPPRSEPALRGLFIALRRAGLEVAYEVQRQALSESGFFVAKYSVERTEGLPFVSSASWANGVVTLLPHADLLALGRKLTDIRPVSSDLAFERFADLLEPVPDLWPPRYLTKGFPTDEALAALPVNHRPDLQAWFDVDETALEVPPPHLLSKEAFAQECLSLLASLGVTGAEFVEEGFGVRYEMAPPPELNLRDGEKMLSQIGFATPWERYAMLPDAERRAATLDYLKAFASRAPSLTTPQRERIMPLLQPSSASWRTPMRTALQFPGVTVVDPGVSTRPFAAGLQIAFVVDSPSSVHFVTQTVASAVAGSADGLFELAVENLRQSTTQPLEALRPGIYVSPVGDEYDAARLLLTERFLTLPLKGHPVVFIPNRVTLLVTGSDDVENLLACVEAVRSAIRTDARPVTRMPLGLTSDGWRPWLPPRTSPARAPLSTLFHEAVQADLADSADLLAARYPDVAVADMGTVDSETTPRVVALVGDGAVVHLPKADVVSRDGGASTEPWASFATRHAAQLTPIEETGGQWFRFEPR